MRLIVRRGARQDRVEVVRVFLRLHQTLPPARSSSRSSTTAAARDRRTPTMSAFDFTVVSCTARYAKSISFSGMADRERRVSPLVAGIGRRGRVAFLQRGRHRRITDDAGPAAVADRLELAVPVLGRQPRLPSRSANPATASAPRRRGSARAARSPARRAPVPVPCRQRAHRPPRVHARQPDLPAVPREPAACTVRPAPSPRTVIVVSDSAIDFRLSHGVAASVLASSTRAAACHQPPHHETTQETARRRARRIPDLLRDFCLFRGCISCFVIESSYTRSCSPPTARTRACRPAGRPARGRCRRSVRCHRPARRIR